MINKNLSIHLQNFPNTSFIDNEPQLVDDMDIVREICSIALFIRDKKNLRVRLPLNNLTIIGKASSTILDYKDIIADEVNVKNVRLIDEIGDLAQFKLQLNFKKVGVKYGARMKEIAAAAAAGKWQKVTENGSVKVKIIDIILENDEFEIKLVTKDKTGAVAALENGNLLVQLDINVTKDLEEEGLARDLVRAIQQSRKDADLNVADYIQIKLFSSDQDLIKATKNYQDYIAEQTLSSVIKIVSDPAEVELSRIFNLEIEGKKVNLGLEVASK